MFTFGKEDQTKSSGVVIFNNGEAGKVDNVTVSVEKLGVDYPAEEGKKLPPYRVVYTDENGGKTNEGFYYLEEASHNATYGTFEKAVQKQWNKVASIITAAGGDPSASGTPQQMLDTVMLKAKQVVEGKTFNVFTNYGTKQNPKKYIQVRSWVPFIELAGTEKSELKSSNLDQLERLDTENAGSGTTAGTEGWV